MGLSSLSGLLTFVLLGALATVGALAWLLKESRSPGPLAADTVVIIAREDDGGSIADQLERAGVIDSAMWFNILTVLDGNRLVPDLKKEDFSILEDGVKQTLISFQHTDLPVSIAIVVDNS